MAVLYSALNNSRISSHFRSVSFACCSACSCCQCLVCMRLLWLCAGHRVWRNRCRGNLRFRITREDFVRDCQGRRVLLLWNQWVQVQSLRLSRPLTTRGWTSVHSRCDSPLGVSAPGGADCQSLHPCRAQTLTFVSITPWGRPKRDLFHNCLFQIGNCPAGKSRSEPWPYFSGFHPFSSFSLMCLALLLTLWWLLSVFNTLSSGRGLVPLPMMRKPLCPSCLSFGHDSHFSPHQLYQRRFAVTSV